jgi:TRAP-type C4-dicarboxylate transport system permease small subunit
VADWSVRDSIRRLNQALAFLAGVSLLVLTGVTVYEVIGRYLFNSPTSWSLEISEYLLVFCIYFAMAYTTQTGAHVSVPLFYSRCSKQTQRIFDAIGSIVLFVFWIILLWQTLGIAMDYLARDAKSETMLGTPLFYPMLLVVIGSFTSSIQAILIIYDSFGRLSGKD